MQPRLAYAATLEVPPSLCDSVAVSQDGGLAPASVPESDQNIHDVGNSVPALTSATSSTLLKPSHKPSYSTSHALMDAGTRNPSTADLIPVYPGNPKGLVTEAEKNEEGLASSTAQPDRIMMALAADPKTGQRHGRDSPPSPPTVLNHVAPSVQPLGPNLITIDYNNVHRLPTNFGGSFLYLWFLPLALIVLLLILIVVGII